MTKSPTPQGISALLRKAGFQRSNYGDSGVMLEDVTEGYRAWKTWHRDAPDKPYTAVQCFIKDAGWHDWDETKRLILARLEEYAGVIREAGYATAVRDHDDDPPWLIVTAREADQ